MPTWHASIGFTTTPPLDEDATFDLLDALAKHGAAMSVSRDYTEFHITMTVEADSAITTTETAANIIRKHIETGNIDIFEARALTPEHLDRELAEPLFPQVVGFAEIAERAGVTRQRARMFPKTAGFPAPVIETAQGPLFNVHAIERWIETRDTNRTRKPVTSTC